MATSAVAGRSAPSDDKRWRQVDVRMRRLGYRPDGLIEVLHTTQEVFGYLDDEALPVRRREPGCATEQGLRRCHFLLAFHSETARACIPASFARAPPATSNGASALLVAIARELGVEPGGTTPDGRVSLLKARCLGACSMAPAVGGRRRGARQGRTRRTGSAAGGAMSASTGPGTRGAGSAAGAGPNRSSPTARPRASAQHLPGCRLPVDGIRPAVRSPPRSSAGRGAGRRRCHGASVASGCAPPGHSWRSRSRAGSSSVSDPASPRSTNELVEQPGWRERRGGRSVAGDPFFSHQVKVVLERCGTVDPERLEDYVATGGYEALAKAVTTMTPDDVIAEVVRSGLRGRGGAGYPTGLKWRTVAKATGAEGKFVVCNADEGDPGAFMDRSVLESDPQRVLEGMAIAGYAVGANQGYVYVRAEYPLAVKRLTSAIRQAEREGFLGQR